VDRNTSPARIIAQIARFNSRAEYDRAKRVEKHAPELHREELPVCVAAKVAESVTRP
jgi:hypothetical protein